jgi:hypothetical protein
MNNISSKSRNFSITLVCAFRHAITKQTGVVDAVVSEIHENWCNITEDDLENIVIDIKANRESLHPSDEVKWMTIVDRYDEDLISNG